MTRPSHPDLHQQVTDTIIRAVEQGGTTVTLPWHRSGLPAMLPHNAHSKAAYNGINIVALWSAAMLRGYPHAIWATYRQWAELGAQVRKGEKASTVIFYKELDVDVPDDASGDDGKRRVARASSVFNAAQVDGFTAAELPELPPIERIQRAETLIAASSADIRHGGEMAFYRRRLSDGSGDFIQMPDERRFQADTATQRSEDYYSVLLHELTHWTSDVHRCNRELGARFGDAAYAMEELVAELGAAFLCAELGITVTPRADHAGYIAHWCDVMKSDKRAIFTAAARASEAVSFLKRLAA
ncbi:MAG: zincin-like metallopeptidase domain-containing protein [Alphaproteobacteria bacterium]|nr:zincin-like metallopeptidase domain-containing protein [Alphaproteobacteria bacterium]